MTVIRGIRNIEPKIHPSCWIAETSCIIGNVTIGKDSSIWYNAVLRGDVNEIAVGEKVNIQDNVTVHCTYEKTKTIIMDEVTVGHNAVLHGCTIHPRVLIGMNAVVLDNTIIKEGAIIAAGAVVKENTTIPPYTLWGGTPAKFIKHLNKEETRVMLEKMANNYILYSSWYKK